MARRSRSCFFITLLVFVQVLIQADGWSLFEILQVEDGKDKNAPDGLPCSTPSDCMTDECCLFYTRNSEPESQDNGNTATQGVCQRLGALGSSCVTPFNGIMPDPIIEVVQMEMCPCAQELECTSSSDIPQEIKGTCSVKSEKPQDKTWKLFDVLSSWGTDAKSSSSVDEEAGFALDNSVNENESPVETDPVEYDDKSVSQEEEDDDELKDKEIVEEEKKEVKNEEEDDVSEKENKVSSEEAAEEPEERNEEEQNDETVQEPEDENEEEQDEEGRTQSEEVKEKEQEELEVNEEKLNEESYGDIPAVAQNDEEEMNNYENSW